MGMEWALCVGGGGDNRGVEDTCWLGVQAQLGSR